MTEHGAYSSTHTRFMELYKPCHDRLGRFVAFMVWDKEEARDLISETLLVALENFDRLKNPQAFLHFLFGIASRLIKQRHRRSQRYRLFSDSEWESLHEKQQVEQNTSGKDLRQLLNHLNEKTREAIVLFEISGFSIKEISEIQNSSLSGVKSRLVRGREKLEKAGSRETLSSTQILHKAVL